jgi:glutathione S-transferase
VKLNFAWHNSHDPEVVKIHALGKIPVLETPHGPLFEQHAILRYLARLSTGRKHLLGKTPYEEALVNQWLDFVNLEIVPEWAKVVILVWGKRPIDEKSLATYVEGKNAVIAKLRIVEEYLKNNTYLAGH